MSNYRYEIIIYWSPEDQAFIEPPQGNPRLQSREELRLHEANHIEAASMSPRGDKQ